MVEIIVSRFIINGVLLEPKSPMPEELVQDNAWSSEVQELQKRLIPLSVYYYNATPVY